MPLQKIQLRPGVNREATTYSNEGGYYACDKVRFRSGFPEQIGGWTRYSNNTYLGVCRGLINWVTLSRDNLLGVGTNLKYYIERGGGYNDITPIRETTAAGDVTFAATDGSTTIVVTDIAHGADVNDFVTFTDAVGLGGNITAGVLNAEHQIVGPITDDTYRIVVSIAANSSDIGDGGTATIGEYQINTGLEVYTLGTGWGSGTWGSGVWGTSGGTGIGQQLRIWSADTYGEDLVFAVRGGSIYYWDASAGLATRGVTLAAAATAAGFDGTFVPHTTNQVLNSGVSRVLIALGANPYDPLDANTAFDPLLVRWSDQENPYDWVPSALNQSGEFSLAKGAYIVAGRLTRQEALIWTDSALYSMQYQGPPYVFNITLLMDNISIISPNAAITINNVTYWMGLDKFYSYSGRVETLPCTLRQFVFGDINNSQGFQVFAGSNEGYNEVWWFYCTADSTIPNRYVIYNYLERLWYYGDLSRTAWLDSPIRSYPMAAHKYDNGDNRILYHESAVDDVSGESPVALNSYIESSDFDIGDGHNFGFVWRILPDVTFDGSTPSPGLPPQVTMSVIPRRNSGAPYGTADSPTVTRVATYPVEEYTGQVYTRIRGRQMAFRIATDRVGTKWQLGNPRIDIRPDGRR